MSLPAAIPRFNKNRIISPWIVESPSRVLRRDSGTKGRNRVRAWRAIGSGGSRPAVAGAGSGAPRA
jgi:hypothetical protein